MDTPQAPKDNNMPDIERARHAVEKAKKQRQSAQIQSPKAILTSLLGIGLLILIYRMDATRQDESAALTTLTPCASDDARCLGARALSQAKDQCLPRLKQSAPSGAEWDDGLSNPALLPEGWYIPGKTLIYGGNRLVAGNNSGGHRIRYFCVTTPTGIYEKHGFPG